jgi:hypothetical protein
LPVLQKLVGVYKIWHTYLPHFPKTSRYTLAEKIDFLFVEIIECIVIASYLSRQEKTPYIKKGIIKLDVLKFFLQVSWEINSIDNKKFINISEKIVEIGKMLGGWNRQLIKENPAFGGE